MSRKLSNKVSKKVIAGLIKIGWTVEGGTIYAPHRTFWLQMNHVWTGSLSNFRIRMLSRLHRTLEAKRASKHCAADTLGLVNLLEELCDDGLQKFFARIEPELTAFAKTHNLLIGKFPQGFEAWDLMFRHPLGGLGRIMIYRVNNTRIRLRLGWMNYLGPICRRKGKNLRQFEYDWRKLSRVLLNSVRQILRWRLEDLSTEFIDRSGTTLQQFIEERMCEKRFPVPRV